MIGETWFRICMVMAIIGILLLIGVNNQETERQTFVTNLMLNGGIVTCVSYENGEPCEYTIFVWDCEFSTSVYSTVCGNTFTSDVHEYYNYTIRASDLKCLAIETTILGFCDECDRWEPVKILTL
jgi:hypothetical protein